MSATGMVARVRQHLYPPEFRIPPVDGDDLADALSEITSAVARLAQEEATPQHADRSAAPQGDSKPDKRGEMETAFVVSLCNDLFRLRRNAETLAKSGSETKEVRSIGRAIERLDDMLKQRGIEYHDMTGKPWDARDVDFEPKGQPVPVPGISRKRIAACECPLVKIGGRMVQRAQGIVEVPA
jgi:hypothetical protein